jgi:hypothetical protein
MAIKRGRRAVSPVITSSANSSADVLNISNGEHDLIIHGATHRVAKSGSVVVLIDAVTDSGVPVKLRPLLVSSLGGSSDLTIRNLEILGAMGHAQYSSNAINADSFGGVDGR